MKRSFRLIYVHLILNDLNAAEIFKITAAFFCIYNNHVFRINQNGVYKRKRVYKKRRKTDKKRVNLHKVGGEC